MSENRFIPPKYDLQEISGAIGWQSPSNIALVKYWGKHGMQLPKNPSLSFTLSACHTSTTLHYAPKKGPGYDFSVILDGEEQPSFRPKIEAFFDRISSYIPFLEHFSFKIETSNSFPHSSGIASSASGMSALALCLMSIEEKLMETPLSKTDFNEKASFLARLGSGSASRSIEGPLVGWGKHVGFPGSDDLYGTRFPFQVHEVFESFQDTILLVDKGEKQVSSTVGHGLMHEHPMAEARFEQADRHMDQLIEILQTGDLNAFMTLVESEALSLHAMMMTSKPYFILMKPATLEVLNSVWQFRKETNIPLCFTLDAGANVHLLYPKMVKETVMQFIDDELVGFCENGQYISDEIGLGAKML